MIWQGTRAPFTKKAPSYTNRNPHYKPKMVWRPSQVYNVNSYTNKTVYPLWIEAQDSSPNNGSQATCRIMILFSSFSTRSKNFTSWSRTCKWSSFWVIPGSTCIRWSASSTSRRRSLLLCRSWQTCPTHGISLTSEWMEWPVIQWREIMTIIFLKILPLDT